MTKTLSLSALSAVAASDTPFEIEYVLPNGEGSGVFLSVLGGQSATVQEAVNKMVNDRRRKQAAAEALKKGPDKADFTPIEDDIAFGHRLTAVRLVGWRGITEDWSAENALTLVRSNADIAEQITSASNNLANFMKASPKA
jgi:hypothetical protein